MTNSHNDNAILSDALHRDIFIESNEYSTGAGLGGGFWVEAVLAACYIRNRCPVAGLNKTPDELWSGKVPSVKH